MSNIAYTIRPIEPSEWEMAMQLAWDTFLIYEAPEYSQEGIGNFQNFVRDPNLKKLFLNGNYPVYGAFYDDIMVGMAGFRNHCHLSLLFVEPQYHHQQIATNLLRYAIKDITSKINVEEMTVNSSPYAVEFYHKFGFKNIKGEQTTDGIRYTPMRLVL